MKKSKYLGMKSGDWTCTHVGVARVQPVFKKKRDSSGCRVKSKNPGHQAYYYIFERPTSDSLADKAIRLNARQIRQVANGGTSVECLAEAKKKAGSRKFTQRVSYSFYPV